MGLSTGAIAGGRRWVTSLEVSPVYLTGFRQATGQLVTLDQMAGEIESSVARRLQREGFDSCYVATRHSVELAIQVLQDKQYRDTVSAIVYATDDLTEKAPQQVVRELLGAVRMEHVPTFVISGNACANFGAALVSAAGVLEHLGTETALLTADGARTGNRVLTEEMSLLGDAAGACLLSHDAPASGYRVHGVRCAMRSETGSYGAAPTANLRGSLDGVGAAVESALNIVGWERQSLTALVVGNYSRSSRRLLAMGADIPFEKVHPQGRIAGGHCFGSDIIGTLHALDTEQLLRPGDRLLALATSPNCWYAASLTYVR
jgi:3-oxoacyl-[acyl-carrier-protein] synthase III